jgi:hypothetical protein
MLHKGSGLDEGHPDTSFVPWSKRDSLFIKNQDEHGKRKSKKTANKFTRYFSLRKGRSTIKHRTDCLACLHQNLRLTAQLLLSHIRDIMGRVLELVRREQPTFGNGLSHQN